VTAKQLTTCLNCDTQLPTGCWCGACGQNNRRSRLELDELVMHALDELFSVDGRWSTTLKGFYPNFGEMAAKYVEGHRAQYVNPVRFLFVAVMVSYLAWESFEATLGIEIVGDTALVPQQRMAVVLFLSSPVMALLMQLIYRNTGRTFAETVCFLLFGMGASGLLFVVTYWVLKLASTLLTVAGVPQGIYWGGLVQELLPAVLIGVYVGTSVAKFYRVHVLYAIVTFVPTMIVVVFAFLGAARYVWG
jgi:uncharacterized protein DUF3667